MLTASGRKPFRLLHTEFAQVTGPSAEPMSIVEAKQQCRRATDETSEDAWFQRATEGARNQVEADTCRALCWQRWKLILDEWPDFIEIYKCPVISVESIKYQNDVTPTAEQITVDPSVYAVSYSEPCRIQPAYAQIWESERSELSVIEVTFTCGYLVPFTASESTDVLTFIDYTPTNGDSFRLTNSGGQLPGGLLEKRTYYVVNASGSTCKLSLTSGGAAIDLTTDGTGLNYLGEAPQAAMQAMRKHIAKEWADREGSANAAACEESYFQSLRAVQYTGAI